jgi:group II intron reverse transcriptase/maturase
MSTDLTRIGEKARKEPKLVFTSLYHHVYDVDNLRSCYGDLGKDKAVGVDGVTKEQYGENLEENLQDLSCRLRDMKYKPQPKRRVYVPKPGSAKGRPLGISCFEDKIVEEAVKRVLEQIYETIFEDSSFGFRPGRNQHQCLGKLGETIQQKRVSYIAEADIKGFFNHVNHLWMIKFVQHRVGDPRIIRIINRMLKGGIMEDGLVTASEEGTPQGSILSPLLSNIYLHYVLDLWFRCVFAKQCQGEAYYFRYADDCAPRRRTGGRKSSVQPCCTRDEGRPLEVAVQAEASNHLLLLRLRDVVVSELGKGPARRDQVRTVESNESEPLMTCRKRRDDVETGGSRYSGTSLGGA